MKKLVVLFVLIFITNLVVAQLDYKKKYYNEIGKSTTEFYPIAEKEYLSFDSYECNSLTINHYKDFEHIFHHIYKRKGNLFLLLAYFSAHDYPSNRGPNFINNENYTLISEHVKDSYVYSDFTFLTDTSILAIANYDFNTSHEVDEWHMVDLNGKLINKIEVPFQHFTRLHKTDDYLIIANENRLLILNNNYLPIHEQTILNTKSIYSIGNNHIAIHTETNHLYVMNISTFDILSTHKVKYVESYDKGYIECLDEDNLIFKISATSDVILINESLKVGDKHYEPIKFSKIENSYLTYGNDSYDYGVAEYRFIDEEIENDVLLDVEVTHKITSLDKVVVIIESPHGPLKSNYTNLKGNYTLKNNSQDTVIISSITQGYGGAYCFTFEDTYTNKLLPLEEKTFSFSKSIWEHKNALNFCLMAVTINGKTDADHKDNKSCSYTVATSTTEYNHPDLSIYPNPTSGLINIKGEIEIKSIKLTDISGKIIDHFNSSPINLTNISNGMYWLIIESNDGKRWIEKCVKVNE